MAKKRVFCSMIEIEREFYPDSFQKRKEKFSRNDLEDLDTSLAHSAIEEVKGELEVLGSSCQ